MRVTGDILNLKLKHNQLKYKQSLNKKLDLEIHIQKYQYLTMLKLHVLLPVSSVRSMCIFPWGYCLRLTFCLLD